MLARRTLIVSVHGETHVQRAVDRARQSLPNIPLASCRIESAPPASRSSPPSWNGSTARSEAGRPPRPGERGDNLPEPCGRLDGAGRVEIQRAEVELRDDVAIAAAVEVLDHRAAFDQRPGHGPLDVGQRQLALDLIDGRSWRTRC